jgi:glycogen operon protein
MYNGMTLGSMDEEGNKVIDDSFLILVNASDNGVEYVLPEPPNKTPWRQVLDTENIDAFYEAEVHDKVILGGRSVRVYTDNLRESPRRS